MAKLHNIPTDKVYYIESEKEYYDYEVGRWGDGGERHFIVSLARHERHSDGSADVSLVVQIPAGHSVRLLTLRSVGKLSRHGLPETFNLTKDSRGAIVVAD